MKIRLKVVEVFAHLTVKGTTQKKTSVVLKPFMSRTPELQVFGHQPPNILFQGLPEAKVLNAHFSHIFRDSSNIVYLQG